MIELLSRLDPATSPYVGNMLDSGKGEQSEAQKKLSDIAKQCRCPTCRGRKRVKAPVVVAGIPASYEVCPACFGSGRTLEGSARETRSRARPESMTDDQIAGLTLGMPDHLFRAAVTFVTHDNKARKMLVGDVKERIVSNQSHSWRLSDDLRNVRVLGLSRIAVYNLLLPRADYVGTEMGSVIMCCTEGSWRKTWSERALDVSHRLEGWVKSADKHMMEMRMAGNDEDEKNIA